ncbi:MAG: Uma2 family endonuclease [Chloroflexi bacterium]|nr:Uma2 family endonuclease [Chloroflexota bacterium]
MAAEPHLVTAEELALMPQEDAHVELVRGAIVKMVPGGHVHGRIGAKLIRAIFE